MTQRRQATRNRCRPMRPWNSSLTWSSPMWMSGKEEREGSSQRGRSSCRTGGDPGGSEPEDEEPEDDADTSEDEGESVFSTYSRRSRDLDVEESQRRDPGRDLIIRPRGDWSPGLLEGDYKQAIQMGESSCRATEEVVCAAAE